MAVNEVLAGLTQKEIDTFEIRLMTKVGRTAATIEGYIATRIIQGADANAVKAELLADLDNDGPLFKEFRNAIKATAHGNMVRLRDTGLFSEQGVDTKYRWVAVLVNTCEDCLKLHNQVMTYDDWESVGLPRTGTTVCGENCRCVLLPENVVEEVEPIMRAK